MPTAYVRRVSLKASWSSAGKEGTMATCEHNRNAPLRQEGFCRGDSLKRLATSTWFVVALIAYGPLLWMLVAADHEAWSAALTEHTELGAKDSYTLFEAGQVRPLALSPDGARLFAINTPDNHLEVFEPTARGLKHCGSVPVGVEPVAVAARTKHEVWVVNHVSDSVSIVRVNSLCVTHGSAKHALRALIGQVTRTLLVGDEPRDIVFGGPHHNLAFITTAHRGQNAPYDPQLTTPGRGRADVWVFDAHALGARMGGEPLTILQLFSDTPRALAVTPNGATVYAAAFQSGNQTTTLFFEHVLRGGGTPPPQTNFEHVPQPPTGLIVQYTGTHWTDTIGRIWDSEVKFHLPDKDVFIIDALAHPPQQVGYYPHVGTTLFNMAVNPVSGKVYVANTDANNLTRFEGPGVFGGSTVRGNLVQSRITVLDHGDVRPIDLNKHVDPSACCAPIPNDTNDRSLAFPLEVAVTRDGKTLYVTAFGSRKIGVFATEELENDTFTPDVAHHVELSGDGPTGIVLDEARQRAYVLTRFDNAVSIIDLRTQQEVHHLSMYNPEPPSIVEGRPFQYDARFTSSNGTQACASCHIFGDMDHLAWDLGDPDFSALPNPGPFRLHPLLAGSDIDPDFAPMKGPMTTQSLRGLANHGPMHWRGDRTGGLVEPSAQPDRGTFSEQLAFKAFNVAFLGLNGRHEQLSAVDMQKYTNFALQMTYPPNPIRHLDNSLTPFQQRGRDFYFGALPSDTFFNCNGCHVLDPGGNAVFGVFRPGFFGTDGQYSFENLPQVVKIPHLRNLYQKVGMFGMAKNSLILAENFADAQAPNAHMGDQIRGFGFLHDGSVDTVDRFLRGLVFLHRRPTTTGPSDPGNPGGFPLTPEGFLLRRAVEEFLLAFDSNLAPIVGQQITLRHDSPPDVSGRIDLLIQRANAGECDLIAKSLGCGYLYNRNGMFKTDRSWERPISDAALRAKAQKGFDLVTYTCAPPGAGVRMGIDRDEDGWLDGDERRAGSNPADPMSTPRSAPDKEDGFFDDEQLAGSTLADLASTSWWRALFDRP
jgi:DNA-binding beta-propeller fold protein YncE